MSVQDTINRAILAYMKKHGDVIDHDQAVGLETVLDFKDQAEVSFVQETTAPVGASTGNVDAGGKKEQSKK